MLAFLIITSSSLVFYVALLVALHRDGRKRRVASGPVRRISLGTVAELGTAPAIFAESMRRKTLKSQAFVSEPAEVITVPKLAHSKNDLQCG